MAIADANSIAQYTGLDTALATKAASHVNRAAEDLRSLLGRQLYSGLGAGADLIHIEEPFEDDTYEYDRIVALGAEDDDYKTLLEAESLLAVVYAGPFLNLRITERGGMVSATGFESTRVEYRSQNQVRQLQREMRQQAHALVRPFTELGRTREVPYAL